MTRMGVPKITEHNITRLDALEDELTSVARSGFACDREEMRAGVCRLASPVYDKSAKVVAYLGIAAPSFRLRAEDRERIGHTVRDLAQNMSAELEGQEGPNPSHRC